jgi:Nif-specific regulatory protein
VGGSHTIQVDIRVIAATNQDLEGAVRAGRFRQDLFFRLNVITLTLPPLRERKDDIPSLAQFFIDRYCRELKRLPMTILPEALAGLSQHSWPGNVRELENVIERAVALALEDEIGLSDLMLGGTQTRYAETESVLDLPFHDSLEAHKEALVRHALAKVQGRKGEAARLLNIHPTYMSRLCRQYSID